MKRRGRPEKVIDPKMPNEITLMGVDKFREKYKCGDKFIIRVMELALKKRGEVNSITIDYKGIVPLKGILNKYGAKIYKDMLMAELSKRDMAICDCLHAIEFNIKVEKVMDLLVKYRTSRRIIKNMIEFIDMNYEELVNIRRNSKKLRDNEKRKKYTVRVLKDVFGEVMQK